METNMTDPVVTEGNGDVTNNASDTPELTADDLLKQIKNGSGEQKYANTEAGITPEEI